MAADLVPDSPDCTDEGAVIAGIHFTAKVVDIDVHNVGHGIEVQLPDLLDNRGSCDRLPLVAHEEFKQSELLWAQFDRVAPSLDRVSHAINLQVANFQDRATRTAPSAEHSANPRRKLGKVARLRQGIVSSGIEQTNMILRKARSGNH